MESVIVADFSWCYHKSFHTFRNFSWTVKNAAGADVTHLTGGMYGVLRDVSRLHRKFHCPIFVAIEPESNARRYELMPGYKGEREKADGFRSCMVPALRALGLFPFVTIISTDELGEADDVIYSFVAQSIPHCEKILIYSRDNDLFQCGAVEGATDKNLFLLPTSKEEDKYGAYRSVEFACTEKFDKLLPKYILMYRSIVGDQSDHIPGVIPRFPHDLARTLAAVCRKPEDLDDASVFGWEGLTPAKKQHLANLRAKMDVWKRNFDVMQLKNVELSVVTPQPITVEECLTQFGMASIPRMLVEAQRPDDQNATA